MSELSTEDRLEQWAGRLCDALKLHGVTIDIDAVLGLAGRAAHTVVRPAAPLTTFVVGFAAGQAALGDYASSTAVSEAIETALALIGEEEERQQAQSLNAHE